MPNRKPLLPLLLFFCLLLSGCYQDKAPHASGKQTVTQLTSDSAVQDTTRFYDINYNFVVKADSMPLLRQQPEEVLNSLPTDTIHVSRHDHIVVVDLRTIPTDPTDSVWVQVARDQETFGWIHEHDLLRQVVPNDPISSFISYFSDTHLLLSCIFIAVIAACYVFYYIFKHKAKVVHFNDIDSFYPTLLALLVASAATFYSSIQLFAPEAWQHFYYHPTLNPLATPTLLAVFLCSVWAIIVVGLATLDDIYHQLSFGEALLYMCGLFGICAIDYIVFSLTTLYYIGYPLLAAYYVFAIRQLVTNLRSKDRA